MKEVFSMKIGILADCFGLGFEMGIKKAAEMKVDGVQLYAVEGELAPENMSAEKRAWAKALIEENGLVISAICGDLGDGGFAFEDRNEGKIAYTKQIVDLALDLGCRIITTHIGVVPEDENHPRFAVIAKALKELGDYAHARGARFAIETGPETAVTLCKMLDYVNSPGIGVNLDPANLIMSTKDDPVAAVHTLKNYIVHTHAKDGVFYKMTDLEISYGMKPWPEDYSEDDCYAEVPLGEGQVPWDGYIAALKEIGFDGYLTIERECGEDPAHDIQLAIDFLKKYV